MLSLYAQQTMVDALPIGAAIFTGSQHTISAANTQMLQIWNKDASVIVSAFQNALPEIRDEQIFELLTDVFTAGKEFIIPDGKAMVLVDGELQEKFFDFYFKPLKDAAGVTFGIINTAVESTGRVLALQQLQTLNEEHSTVNEELQTSNEEVKAAYQQLNKAHDALAITEQKAKVILENSPVASGVIDANTYLIETANNKLLELWNTDQYAIGRNLGDILPQDAALVLTRLIDMIKANGRTVYGKDVEQLIDRSEQTDTAYYNFIYQPIKNTQGEVISVQILAADVTDQRKAKAEVDAALLQFSLAQKATGFGVFDLDVQHDLLYWDERCRKIFGVDQQKEITYGSDFIKGLHPDDRDKTLEAVTNAYNQQLTGGVMDIEYRVIDASNGNICWVRALGQVYFNDEAEPQRLIGTVLDISESVNAREKLEDNEQQLQNFNEELTASNEELSAVNEEYQSGMEELQASNEQLLQAENMLRQTVLELENNKARLQNILDTIGEGIGITDAEGNIIYNNKRARQILKVDEQSILERKHSSPEWFNRRLNGTPMPHDEHPVSIAIATGKPVMSESILVQADGDDPLFLRMNATPLIDDEGKVTGAIGSFTDITATYLKKQETENMNAWLTIAISAGKLGYTEVDLASGLMRCNDRFKECYGRAADEEFTYPQLFEAMLPQYREDVMARVAKSKADNSLYHAEYEVRWPDGSTHWISANGRPRYNDQGEADRMVGIISDITERKNSEMFINSLNAQLAESEERLRLTISAAQIGTWDLDIRNNVVVWDERCQELYGFSKDEAVPYDELLKYMHPDDRAAVDEAVKKALDPALRREYNIVFRTIGTEDGRLRWLHCHGKAYFDEQGLPFRFSGTAQDITPQREEAQRRLDFIGIVSHELRSPLTSLNGYVQMLQLKARRLDDTSIVDISNKASRQVERMRSLISGFLEVARIGEGKIKLALTKFDIAALVKQAEEESLATITTHKVVFDPVIYRLIDADHDKVEQVLVNFINNAVKYSPQGSTINVSCISDEVSVRVCVKDQGMGISGVDQAHIFDRFYRVDNDSTKTIKGFGIGLYICREIIELHGGSICVSSNIGEGSEFWFTLPIKQ